MGSLGGRSPRERLVNGKLETGDFTGWTRSGITSIVTSPVHSGTYAARLGYVSHIIQNLAANVKVKDIVSAHVFGYGETVLGQQSNLTVTYYYDDLTSVNVNHDLAHLAWGDIDMLAEMDLTKTLTGIRLRSWRDTATNLWVDDASIMAY
jgi:hypothetical protein